MLSSRSDSRESFQVPIQLFEFVPEEEFNESEKAVAWYLEYQRQLFFWYRNRSRFNYWLQVKDKILRFEVLAEDEWEGELNELLTLSETKGRPVEAR